MAVPIWFNGLISRFNRPYSPLPLILFESTRLSPLILFERVTGGDGDIDTCFRDIELFVCLCFELIPMPLLLVVVDDDVLLLVFSDVSRGKLDGRTTIAFVITKRSQHRVMCNYNLEFTYAVLSCSKWRLSYRLKSIRCFVIRQPIWL